MNSTLNKKEILDEKYLSISKFCDVLSISIETAKNWIKLNKIKPDYKKNSEVYFSKDYVKEILTNIKSNSTNVLKSRRNKKHISGSFLYKDYISESSKNLEVISSITDYIEKENLNLSDTQIKYMVADCAIQLLLKTICKNPKVTKNFLYEYLNQTFSLGNFEVLIDDLIDNKNNALKFIKTNPKLFETEYFYTKDEDILGLLYISLSNLGKRKSKGSYYTPTKVVKKMVNNLDFTKTETKPKKILDSSCGSGNFLLQLPDNIDIKNIFGNDIDNNAIKIARLNMVLKFKVSNVDILYKNFTNRDFLIDEFDEKFDYIIGNPPWGAEFPKKTSQLLKNLYRAADNKNIESYDVFLEKSLSILKKGGYLSFVLPEAIMSVKTHKTIRNLIVETCSITYLEFLGNIFNKVHCPSIILQLKHTLSPISCVGMRVVSKNKSFIIKKEREITSDVFSFDMDDIEFSIYKKLIKTQNKLYLKDNAIFALGLVTGDNKKYIANTKTRNREVILRGSDIEKYRINLPNSYIEYLPEKFQQVAPTQFYRAKEKLFYRFISNELVFAYDDKQTLSLNSCNIVIPRLEGYDIKYILAILNSKIAQFIFKKTYNSVKVLRSHIESIPIPICSKGEQVQITKLVDKIMESGSDYQRLYEGLEKKISKLYGIKEEEYRVITGV